MQSWNSMKRRGAALPAELQGGLWMLLAAAFYACLSTTIRQVTQSLHPFEAVFFRNVFSLAFMLPWLLHVGVGRLKTEKLHLHVARGLTGLCAMLAMFYAFSLIPLADATALSFTAPLFLTVGATVLLGEKMRLRRWVATVIGFCGALLIIRPGFTEITHGVAIMLVSAIFMASSALLIRKLTRTEEPNVVVMYMLLIITPLSAIPAAFVWRMPSAEELAWLVALGAFATLVHLSLTRAFRNAEASYVVPFDFARLPFVALVAFLAFGELPDIWTWIGGGIIFTAGAYIARREAVLAKQARIAELKKMGNY
jgi:drug/metabolite transporter (DMT)-like permease